MRSIWAELVFGEYAWVYLGAFTLICFVFLHFILTTGYRKWWIYRKIMGDKAKAAGYRNWTQNLPGEKEKREAEEAAAKAEEEKRIKAEADGMSGGEKAEEAQDKNGAGQEP